MGSLAFIPLADVGLGQEIVLKFLLLAVRQIPIIGAILAEKHGIFKFGLVPRRIPHDDMETAFAIRISKGFREFDLPIEETVLRPIGINGCLQFG